MDRPILFSAPMVRALSQPVASTEIIGEGATVQLRVDENKDGSQEITVTDAQGFSEVPDGEYLFVRHGSSQPVVDGWLPIETAPKDGRVLAVATGKIERISWSDPAAVVTVKAYDGPFVCHVHENGSGFTDEFGEVYRADGIVIDAEDLTAADNVLRITHWHSMPALPSADGAVSAKSQHVNSGAFRRLSKAEWMELGGDSNPKCDWHEGIGYVIYDDQAHQEYLKKTNALPASPGASE